MYLYHITHALFSVPKTTTDMFHVHYKVSRKTVAIVLCPAQTIIRFLRLFLYEQAFSPLNNKSGVLSVGKGG